MGRRKPEVTEEVLVEILIRIEGSSNLNRITTFKLPLLGRSEGSDEMPGEVQFESLTMIRRMKEALNKLR